MAAFDEISGRTGAYPVTATFNHLDPVVVALVIDGERIETTPEHPFYADKRWIAAAELRIGDAVRRVDGSVGLVESVQIERRAQRMYNLTVARAHTFFVGDDGWLVHNECPIPNSELLGPPPKRGNAPIGADGHPIELHHNGQMPDSELVEMTRTDHRLGDNFSANHSNTGQSPSQIDRSKWRQQQQQYWKEQWDSGRFDE